MYEYPLMPCFTDRDLLCWRTPTLTLTIGLDGQTHEWFPALAMSPDADSPSELLRRQFQRLAAEHPARVVGEGRPMRLHPVDAHVAQSGSR
jgi:hypothetical protein